MKLSDALNSDEHYKIVGRQCSMKEFIQQLDDDDAAALSAALASNRSSASIFRALKSVGFSASESSLKRHRNKECMCPDE